MLVIITNLPTFYKNKLFSEINEKREIFVIFTGQQEFVRNADFFSSEKKFEHVFIKGHQWSRIIQTYRLIKEKKKVDEIMVCGWNTPTNLVIPILFPKSKLSCQIESSLYVSKTSGVKGFIKKMFLRRMSKAYVSGKIQEKLAKVLGFKRKIIITGGCGILNYIQQPSYSKKSEIMNFIYVGRLSEEKNLPLLINAFNRLPQLNLNIIGFGPQENVLREISNVNIHFLGAIENAKLSHYYQENDVFVLPSKMEAWGLVVEEALNNGLPVIVSDHVGCKDDLVTKDTGIVFKSNDIDSLTKAIKDITDVTTYNNLRRGVAKLNFLKRSKQQVESYLTH